MCEGSVSPSLAPRSLLFHFSALSPQCGSTYPIIHFHWASLFHIFHRAQTAHMITVGCEVQIQACTFRALAGLNTQTLANMLNVLVRVSRRVDGTKSISSKPTGFILTASITLTIRASSLQSAAFSNSQLLPLLTQACLGSDHFEIQSTAQKSLPYTSLNTNGLKTNDPSFH